MRLGESETDYSKPGGQHAQCDKRQADTGDVEQGPYPRRAILHRTTDLSIRNDVLCAIIAYLLANDQPALFRAAIPDVASMT